MEGVLQSWILRVVELEGILRDRNDKLSEIQKNVSALRLETEELDLHLGHQKLELGRQKAKRADLALKVGENLHRHQGFSPCCSQEEAVCPYREGSQGSEAASLDLRDIISQEELAMKRFKVLVNQHHNEKMQSIVKLMQESSEVVKRVMNITPSQLQMLLHDAMKRLSLSQTELGTLTNMLEGTKIVNMNLQEQISGMDMGVLKIEEAKFQANLAMAHQSLAALLQQQQTAENRMYEARQGRDSMRQRKDLIDKDLLHATAVVSSVWH